MSQCVFVDLFEMSASKVLVNGEACLPHRVTQGKNVGHGEGTTTGAKGTRIITSLCLMCFLWFLPFGICCLTSIALLRVSEGNTATFNAFPLFGQHPLRPRSTLN